MHGTAELSTSTPSSGDGDRRRGAGRAGLQGQCRRAVLGQARVERPERGLARVVLGAGDIAVELQRPQHVQLEAVHLLDGQVADQAPLLVRADGLVQKLVRDHGVVLFHDKIAVLVFCVVRLVQMAAMPMTVFVLEFDLYKPLAWTHFALTCVCGCLDILDVVLRHMKQTDDASADAGDGEEEDDTQAPLSSTRSLFRLPAINEERMFTPNPNSAFSIEPVRRKRFVFSMAHRTRWPVKPRRVEDVKKKS